MSWLFGKKKHHNHKDSLAESAEETESSTNPDEFIFIEKQETSVSFSGDGIAYPSGNLYPLISGAPTYPTLSTDLSKQNQQDVSHYLNGVSFKLCKQLEINMNNDFEIDRMRVSEILSFIERIENENFNYDYNIEKSVISEMNSTSNE